MSRRRNKRREAKKQEVEKRKKERNGILKDIRPKSEGQKEVFRAISDPDHNYIGITGPAGSGKAQPLDSKVLTPDGWKKMGDLQLYDKVVAHDGTYCDVTGVFPRGKKEVYKITFEDGRIAESCKEHLWEVFHWEWKTPRILTLEEITRLLNMKAYRNRLYVRLYEPQNIKNSVTDLDPYLVGCLLGDGCLLSTPSFSSADVEIIEELEKRLPDPDLKFKKRKGSKYDYSISYSKGHKNKLKFLLEKYGMYYLKSDEKKISESYLKTLNLDEKWELLRGLMDTDGTTSGGHCSYSTCSKQLASDIQNLVWSLGGLCKITQRQTYYTYKDEKREGKKSYRLSIRVKKPNDLFKLSRKRNKLKSKNQYSDVLKLRFKSVEFDRIEECQCISIDHKDRLYVTDNYIVTHNTLIATYFAAQYYLSGDYDKIIICRSVTTIKDEDIGYLKGGISGKLGPFTVPMMENLKKFIHPFKLEEMQSTGKLETLPLAYVRGRSLENCIVLLDEAQNVSIEIFKTLLTRINDESLLIAMGDCDQNDKFYGQSDFKKVCDALGKLPCFAHVELDTEDIVRSKWISKILALLEPLENNERI